MEPTFGQIKERAPARPMPGNALPSALSTAKEIPYDYVVTFTLQGRPGNREQGVINISTDGAFVATAVGYSFIHAAVPAKFAIPNTQTDFFTKVLTSIGAIGLDSMAPALLARFAGIDFKYSIIDSGSGRELQNKAIHNIAGLGESAGNRPFLPFAKPQLFLPRSTIRIEIEEVSLGIPDEKQNQARDQLYSIYGYTNITNKTRVGPELFIVLHGYKILGYG